MAELNARIFLGLGRIWVTANTIGDGTEALSQKIGLVNCLPCMTQRRLVTSSRKRFLNMACQGELL